jgi:tRNA nucleotidyltransferase/poly(A) polymerase
MKLRNPSILARDPLLGKVWRQLGRPAGCRVIGGYIRDRLLGRPSNDLDLTIEGTAGEAGVNAKRLAKALGVRAHLFGTAPNRIWRIEAPTLKVELWPLGGLTAEEDILRRDFSCNALSWELPDGPIVDLVGGTEDVERGRLRAITHANLESDPIRLLRAPRFLAQLPTFDLDGQTRSWILELSPSLASAPRERVGQELLKMLRGPAASRGIAECLALDLLGPASPAADRVDDDWITTHLSASDSLAVRHHAGGTPAPQKAHRDRGAGVSPAGTRISIGGDAARLGLLFRGWGVPSRRALAPYAWQRSDREAARTAALHLDAALSMVDAPAADRRELAWHTGSAFPTLIALTWAIEPEHSCWQRWWRQWSRNPAAFEHPQPLLSGTEVTALTGIDPGPTLGKIVHALLRAQVRSEVRTRGGAKRWLAARCAGS